MNRTPRALNRILLALLGLVFLGAGASLLGLALVPAAAAAYGNWAVPAAANLRDVFDRTRLTATGASWIWIAVAAVLLVLIVLMVVWIAAQGRGRANVLTETTDGDAPGTVIVNGAVAEHALRSALAERTDLVAATVSTYRIAGQPALKIRVLPRQGVSPRDVAENCAELVAALEVVLGCSTPVLISICAGARTRFTRAERVR